VAIGTIRCSVFPFHKISDIHRKAYFPVHVGNEYLKNKQQEIGRTTILFEEKEEKLGSTCV
jgi:hypothetical protein